MSSSRSKKFAPPAAGFAHRNLPLLLLQARESVLARFRPVLNANGVTEQQWRIVRALLESGPLEPRQIGALCGISSPSMVGILARMEALDLVTRERLEHDQRRVLVSLTATSRALAARLAPDIESTYGQIETLMSAEFVAGCYAMLDELIERLGAGDAADES